LSKTKQRTIEDTGRVTFKDKLIKYPEIITGYSLWREEDDPPNVFLSFFKKFRDSIVHPSPFPAPERFGGHDKLQIFYSVNIGVSMVIAQQTVNIIDRIHKHINGSSAHSPAWLDELTKLLKQYETSYG